MMYSRIFTVIVIALSAVLPQVSLADVYVPPWGEALGDSIFININIDDTATVVDLEVRSAVIKLINDDYYLRFERNSELGQPLPNPEVRVSDRLVQSGWQNRKFQFEYYSRVLVEDTLHFSVRTRYVYPVDEQNSALAGLIYASNYRRFTEEDAWLPWGEEVPMSFFSSLPRFTEIKTNRTIRARAKVWVDWEYIWSGWQQGTMFRFSDDGRGGFYETPRELFEIDLGGQRGLETISDEYSYFITPEMREAVQNLILDEEVNIQMSADYMSVPARISGYSMLSNIRLEPGLASSISPMWLWFPNDQTGNVNAELNGLRVTGAWGNYYEGWHEDTLETRLAQVNTQNGFYIHVPCLYNPVENPNDIWWWSDPRLRVRVSQRGEADSCRFILITAPIDPSVVRFTIPPDFEFAEWNSPFDIVRRENRGQLGNSLSFSGLCREPGIARVVWQLAQSVPVESTAPEEFRILSVTPNPFNARTMLAVRLPSRAEMRLNIFDVKGDLVWEEFIPGEAGENKVVIDSGSLTGGVYFLQLKALNKIERVKIVLLK